MKKHTRTITAALSLLLVCALLLGTTGCTSFIQGLIDSLEEAMSELEPQEQRERRTVKYGEMVYERPDYDGLAAAVQNVADVVRTDGISYDEQLQLLNDLDAPYYTYESMYSLAYIKFSITPSDKYWSGECDFFDETYATLMQEIEDIYVACANSKYKSKWEEDYFGEGFLDDYIDGGKMTDEMVALYQTEASLTTTYLAYDYDPEFEYNGTMADVYTHLQNDNYVHYNQIVDLYYRKINEDLGGLFVQIVAAREQIAQGQGYDSYAEYAFDRELSRDYTAEQADSYVADVIRYIVPLYKELDAAGKLGDPGQSMSMSAKLALNALCSVTSRMDDRFTEITDFMKEYDLYYLGYNDDQTNESFTTYIEDYDAPFICIHGTKTADDLMTFVHEFGHFTDGYLNWNSDNVLDQCETASQGLEYLFLCNVTDDDVFRGGEAYLKKLKSIDTVNVFISQSLFHYFESRVYSLSADEITLDNINAIAGDAVKLFGLENDESYSDFGLLWCTIPHFFNQAFYVISYVTSQDVALQIYERGIENAAAGTELYFNVLQWDEEMTFVENVARAGLEDPFAQGHVEAQAEFLRSLFDE